MARVRRQQDCGSGRRSADAYRWAALALRASRGQRAPWAGKYNPAPRAGRYRPAPWAAKSR